MQAETSENLLAPKPGFSPQRAILLAWCDHADPHLQALNVDCIHTPLMGRPFVQRAVEELASLGCVTIHVVTGEQDHACQHLLGSGERFGVTLNYVQATTFDLSQILLNALGDQAEAHLWLASAMVVPSDETLHHLITQSSVRGNAIIVSNHDSKVQWSGWGILNRSLALALVHKVTSEQDLEQALLRDPNIYRTQCTNALTLQSGATALRALVGFMEKGHPAGIVDTRMRAPGVWVAGDSAIDPGAILKPPIYIGHQVRIDAGAVVGPGVVIEEGSMIEAGASVRNSWILPNTYVGNQITLLNTIVSGNNLLSLDHKALIKITDPFLLDGDIHTRTAIQEPGRSERLLALVLWLIAKPLIYRWQQQLRLEPYPVEMCEYLVAFPDRMRYGFETHATALKPTMQQVRDGLPYALATHFFKTFYPGLRDIWQGRVKFIGLEPHTLDEMLKLSQTEQLRYAHWPIGLINEAIVMGRHRKEIRNLQGMPLLRTVQLVIAYGQQVRRSVAQAVTSQHAFTSPNDAEPQFKQVSRTEQMMKLSQIKPGVAVVLITDESLDIHNVKTFHTEIKSIIEQNHVILLDMHQLSFIDSSGLSELLDCLRVTTKRQATFRLFGMSQTLQALFRLVRMSRVFKIYATDAEALENLPEG